MEEGNETKLSSMLCGDDKADHDEMSMKDVEVQDASTAKSTNKYTDGEVIKESNGSVALQGYKLNLAEFVVPSTINISIARIKDHVGPSIKALDIKLAPSIWTWVAIKRSHTA